MRYGMRVRLTGAGIFLLATTSWSGTDAHLRPEVAVASFAERFAYPVHSDLLAAAKSRVATIFQERVTSAKKEDRLLQTQPGSVLIELPRDLVFSPAQAPPPAPSRRELCKQAASVAAEHNLPVPFFANLIWQESGFQTDVVSHAGAQGIAQFMPRTASAYGLDDPFDPGPSLVASGKLLSDLRAQFGNLGLAAAAYNAGPKRVLDWMVRRRRLPGETRNYVKSITGRPAEHWIGTKVDGAQLMMPRHAPCLEVALALESQAKTQGADSVEIVSARKVTTTVKRAIPKSRQVVVAAVPAAPVRSARSLKKKRTIVLASASTKALGVRKPINLKPMPVAAKQPRQPAVKVKLVSTHKAARARHTARKPSAGAKVKVAVAR